jgi:hypothetical protein
VIYSLLAKLASNLLSIHLADTKQVHEPYILYIFKSFVDSYLFLEQRLASSRHLPTSPAACRLECGISILHSGRELSTIRQAPSQSKAPINAAGGYYGTVLHAAVPSPWSFWRGNAKAMGILLEASANVKFQRGKYKTPLQAAPSRAKFSDGTFKVAFRVKKPSSNPRLRDTQSKQRGP